MNSTNVFLSYEKERDCNLRQIGEPLDRKGYGIALKKGKCLLSFLLLFIPIFYF